MLLFIVIKSHNIYILIPLPCAHFLCKAEILPNYPACPDNYVADSSEPECVEFSLAGTSTNERRRGLNLNDYFLIPPDWV